MFHDLKVPDELQGALLKPYLHDKSMDTDQSNDYQPIKSLILKEFQLSPATYRETFNSLSKLESETFSMFATRLKVVLSYYCDSRKIETVDDLTELIICDHIKATLSDSCLRHVLSLESSRSCYQAP